MRFSLRTLLIVVTAIALLLAVMRLNRTEAARGVTPEQANRVLWRCNVPDNASDVWFTTDWRLTAVECTMDESTFLEWATSNGWRPYLEPVSQTYALSIRDELQGNANYISIKSGYQFGVQRTLKLTTVVYGYFDAQRNRAYVVDKGIRWELTTLWYKLFTPLIVVGILIVVTIIASLPVAVRLFRTEEGRKITPEQAMFPYRLLTLPIMLSSAILAAALSTVGWPQNEAFRQRFVSNSFETFVVGGMVRLDTLSKLVALLLLTLSVVLAVRKVIKTGVEIVQKKSRFDQMAVAGLLAVVFAVPIWVFAIVGIISR